MKFYEYIKFGDYYYGTGQIEWDTCDVFIMEASAVKAISKKERKKCWVYFLNPSKDDRHERMWTNGRNWSYEKIANRFETDDKLFKDFVEFDIEIKNPDF
jgi:guanylate kinase